VLLSGVSKKWTVFLPERIFFVDMKISSDIIHTYFMATLTGRTGWR
jgi:hypothetical protein